MSFEKDYQDLLKKAQIIVSDCNYNLLPEDLINEVFIQMHDSGIKYEKALFIVKMRTYFSKEKTMMQNHHTDVDYKEKFQLIQCEKCKEEKDSSQYNFIRYMEGVYKRDKMCRQCRRPSNKKSVNTYWQKQKENLTDTYIKSLLTNGKPNQKILRSLITKDQIEAKRLELLTKRDSHR